MALKYNILAIDLDDTLLNNAKEVSANNLHAIQHFYTMGGQIIFVTGRPPFFVKKIISIIKEKTGVDIRYFVALNGAYVYDNEKQIILSQTTIPSQEFKIIYDLAISKKLSLIQYNEKDLNANAIRINKTFWAKHYKTSTQIIIDNNFNDGAVYKANFFSPFSSKISKIEKIIKEKYSNIFSYFRTEKYILEINALGVNKFYGLSKILAINSTLDISKIVAFGDSLNDYEIFKAVPVKIAPSNAHPILLKQATLIVKDHDESGVAEGIETIIANKIP